MALIFPLILISMAVLGALAWAALGLPALLALTYGLTDFCQSLLVRCVEYSSILEVAFLWAGFLTLCSGLVYGMGRAATNLVRTARAVKKLPLTGRGRSVVLIRDGSRTAFTHGFLNPRVYLSTGLLDSLEREEKQAVFLHELHHRRRRDPLRFFLFNLLKDSFFYIPALRHMVGSAIARGEHEADRAGAEAGPLSLASALVKVASFNRASHAGMLASITGGGGAKNPRSMTARVERLVEGTDFRHAHIPARQVAASIMVALVLSVSLALPVLSSSEVNAECTTDHCAVHSDKLGQECKTHCELSSHGKHHSHLHG